MSQKTPHLFANKTWRMTDHPPVCKGDETYDEVIGPRGPMLHREPLRSELEATLGLESFDDQVSVMRLMRKQPHVCGCSDEERLHCKKPC